MEALPRELALRIALASRILPGIDVPRLLEILHERVGSPLDDEKLKSITVTNLKTGLGSLDGEEDRRYRHRSGQYQTGSALSVGR